MNTRLSTFPALHQDVGAFIPQSSFEYLVKHYEAHFPGMTRRLFIPARVLQELMQVPGISGLRFMHAMENLEKPATSLVLMPCMAGEDKRPPQLPDILFRPQGFRLHSGENLGLKRAWQLMFNYVWYMKREHPEQEFSSIHRGVFWGISKLRQLMDKPELQGCLFHFGYDPNGTLFEQGEHPVISAISGTQFISNDWLDVGQRYPPDIPPGTSEFGIYAQVVRIMTEQGAEEQLQLLRDFRERLWLTAKGYLAEMYHYTSPALTARINPLPDRDRIYRQIYRQHVQPCVQAIQNRQDELATALFEAAFAGLVQEYLWE